MVNFEQILPPPPAARWQSPACRWRSSGLRPGGRARAWCGALLFAGLALFSGRAAEPTEVQVKAAFLYNFTKFTEWPARHFAASDSPIIIGVLGSDSFGAELEKIVRDRRVNGRAFVVRILDPSAEAAAIDVLFVAAGEESRFDRQSAEALRTAGVLTVGETPRFAALSGIITFALEADKVRFEINQGAAELAGLKLSAQLLKLATTVRKNP